MRLIITALIAFLQMAVVTADAKTHKVPQDFAKIQLAINAAVNGDTVLVDEGTYFENLVITKKIVLGSLYVLDKDTAHISKTILNGSTPTDADTAATITCIQGSDTTTMIVGFTITGGKGNKHFYTPPTYWIEGGGIDVMSGGATIRKNIIRHNVISSGSDSSGYVGISVVTLQNNFPVSHVIVEDNMIMDNSQISSIAGGGGCGVGFYNSKGRISNNIVINNSGKYGGGISVGNYAVSDTVYIENNLVQGNVVSVNIGGIDFAGSIARGVIRDNVIIDNTAGSIGGIAVGFGAKATVERNYIARNAGGTIGGIYVYSVAAGSVIIRNNIVVENTGDGIRTAFNGAAGVFNNTIINNTRYGLFVRSATNPVDASTLRGLNNIVWGNTEGGIAGNAFSAYSLVQGGFAGTRNINTAPLFVPNDTLYHLSVSSPCIGVGAFSSTVGGVLLTAPSNDYHNSSRPNPSWSKPDLGAMESDKAISGALHTYRVPQDYTKIQEAINASVNGDVVLVDEGTYFENLVITKKIVLGSLYVLDKDTAHISKTILNGSTPYNADSASVITIDGAVDTTTTVIGFTITGGKGNKRITTDATPITYKVGLGIDVEAGGATIRNNILTSNNLTTNLNVGGIVNIWDVDNSHGIQLVIVEDNIIADNIIAGRSVEGGAMDIGHNARISRNSILRNSISGSAAGIGAVAQIWEGTILFNGNYIRNNFASKDGGVLQINQWGNSHPTIMLVNNIISNNSAGNRGGAIWMAGVQTTVTSINNTFTGNTATNGATVYTSLGSTFNALNTIFWDSKGTEIVTATGGVAAVQYSNVKGEFTGTGNISIDPLFVPDDSLYHLEKGSPCINTGIDTAIFGGMVLTAPYHDYFGKERPPISTPDMGAVEDSTWTGVEDLDVSQLPTSYTLSQNYPNPFNPSTTIRFALPSCSHVKLTVHDILGREIVTLVDERLSAGWKEVVWDAFGKSSGIYFYKLTSGSFVGTKKLMYLK